ncbi:uncharacterized protein PHACADRAFT_149103 [Phanerochaete carnosa HHB-10118-sp]|uniref:FAD/NAD(P)-binding domain-containing protein n=1 Tax=Phanerochaete carnosa (strain HHB-10118-sp) TaxID=650164 RepID=K5URE4_PHACS|nr:uncharacterized protein PHACADRAFT_149103 [Phanerochaete carnosa HHB-10118-sp]EKM52446.1 hypothetical protein PHACADRAFT_149103 [Phanerochaete carnosa HHB-10118-sp]
MDSFELEKSICVIGSGAAGLISAQVLVQDGFKNVEVITCDQSPGGTWAEERMYPELKINNVYGEYRFSSLPMPPPTDTTKSGGRLGGEDMRLYMESFADRFLRGKLRYNTIVTNIRSAKPDLSTLSSPPSKRWIITVRDRNTGEESQLRYDRVVLCTGGCSTPKYPVSLSPEAAKVKGFKGPVFHSLDFKKNVDKLLKAVQPQSDPNPGHAVVIGGGKSAWDAAAYLANRGRKVSVVFETSDSVMGTASPLPEFVRKSRLLAVLSSSRIINTRLEYVWFLHQTWLGSKITHFVWNRLAEDSFKALGVPKDSPLRNTHSLFWGLRLNDEGVPSPDRFFGLVKDGKIDLIAPARATGFGSDGSSVILGDGRVIAADAVVLCTGFQSSWTDIFDKETYEEIGLDVHPPPPEDKEYRKEYAYASLANPSGTGALLRQLDPTAENAAAIYRGIIPAKSILNRDFAVNGSIFTTNPGYVFEICAHWIASYFRRDPFLRVPTTVEAAVEDAERNNSWLRVRFPGMLGWANDSYSADMAMLGWPQLADTLLQDMDLPIMRSGGNWFTWPFKVLDLKEIEYLEEERIAKRVQHTTRA